MPRHGAGILERADSHSCDARSPLLFPCVPEDFLSCARCVPLVRSAPVLGKNSHLKLQIHPSERGIKEQGLEGEPQG